MTTSNPMPTKESTTSSYAGSKEGMSTTSKMASAAHTAVDIAAENLAHAEKALRDARAAAGEKVSETAKQAQAYSQDAAETARTYIDLYPLRSVGIALAAGFLLAVMIKK